MREEFREQFSRELAEVKTLADSGDAEAQYQYFMMLSGEAMETCSEELFNEAELYLMKSAESGNSEAKECLVKHDTFRYAFQKRVSRRGTSPNKNM
jgi:hypothetical protein